ncbi:MAG: YqzE family protein [Paenibacillaceae bacterium]
MAKDGDKLVRYITQQVVTFLDTPRTTRLESRKRNKSNRENWVLRWFGFVPFALSFWYKNVKKRRRRKA